MNLGVPERYVRLCLRVEPHIEGFVDAYVGPPEWRDAVAREAPVDPAALRDEAAALLDALDEAGLEQDRARWLRGQLEALECATARLSGVDMSWADEVERSFGVRPTRTDTSAFVEAHGRLDAALPGSGSVRDRYLAWDERNAVPRDALVPALERLKEALGPRAHALASMPAEESVTYELVSGVPWLAYNWYEGAYRSRVDVNAELPISIVELVALAAHEAYPGHHSERVAKDALLTRAKGRVETSVTIISAPEALVSEGIATNALEQALGTDPYTAVAEVLGDLVTFDPAEAQEVTQAEAALEDVGTNAAFMLHEDGAAAGEVEAYLRDWALSSDEKATRAIAFFTDPASRIYVSTYADGRRVCASFAARAPGNFTRLLTEQLTTADLLAPS
jgi:hypothetical protein